HQGRRDVTCRRDGVRLRTRPGANEILISPSRSALRVIAPGGCELGGARRCDATVVAPRMQRGLRGPRSHIVGAMRGAGDHVLDSLDFGVGEGGADEVELARAGLAVALRD